MHYQLRTTSLFATVLWGLWMQAQLAIRFSCPLSSISRRWGARHVYNLLLETGWQHVLQLEEVGGKKVAYMLTSFSRCHGGSQPAPTCVKLDPWRWTLRQQVAKYTVNLLPGKYWEMGIFSFSLCGEAHWDSHLECSCTHLEWLLFSIVLWILWKRVPLAFRGRHFFGGGWVCLLSGRGAKFLVQIFPPHGEAGNWGFP